MKRKQSSGVTISLPLKAVTYLIKSEIFIWLLESKLNMIYIIFTDLIHSGRNLNKNNTEQNNNDNNNKKQKQQQETIKSTKMKMIKCFHSVWHSL